MPFEKRELWCERTRSTGGRTRLFGELYLPLEREATGVPAASSVPSAPSPAPLPTVVLAHPFAADHTFMRPYAELLAERGFAAYAFDFFGGGLATRSDGKLTDMSVETEVADLEAVIELMRAQPFCDADRLFLMGASQGGFVASVTANRHPELVRALVLLYPAYVLHDDALDLFPEGTEVPETYEMMGITVGARYGRDARALDPFDEMGRFGGNVLIMHGDADGIVSLGYSERAVRTFAHAELEVMPGAGHGFRGDAFVRSAQLAKRFLAREAGLR
jgi:pimeloyl-ACP methyl ester carboxylesterase